MATLATFNNNNETVQLKARGRAITTAVDVAEITRNRYMTDMEPPKIIIGTETVEDEKGSRNISTITIELTKGNAVVPQDVFKRRSRKQEKPEEAPPEEAAEAEAEEAAEEKSISDIKGVGEATAEKLRTAGYDTVSKIVEAESFELALKTGLSEKQVVKIIEAAKELIGEPPQN